MQFDEIYASFQPKVLRFFIRMFNDEAEAEDLCQEVFIKINRGLHAFRGDSSLSTWIYKIASNVANDRFRSASFQKGKKKVISKEKAEGLPEDRNVWTGEQEPLADQRMVKEEMNQCILNYVHDLDKDYRTVLILSEYEGLKNKEIAEVLGVSLDTVKIRLHRGRAKLKKRMSRECELYYDSDSSLCCDKKTSSCASN